MQHIPSSLESIQQWFAQIITSPMLENQPDQLPQFSSDTISDIRRQIAASPTLSSEERMGIYQQQYWWRLISVLQEMFPSVVALLGAEEFNHLIAQPYLSAHLSSHWFISKRGANLPQWLVSANFNKTLIGFAELDLIYDRLLFAEILPCLQPPACADELIYLQPFVCLLELDPELFRLYRNNLKDYSISSLQMKWNNKKCMVIYRFNEINCSEEVSPAVFELLKRFEQGACLQEVIPLLEQCEDVYALFETMGKRGWLCTGSSCFNNKVFD